MNNFTAVVKIASTPELKYVGENQTAYTNPTLELMTRYGTGDLFVIDSVAWGKAAEHLSRMEIGAIALVTGQLNVLKVDRGDLKESIASMKISTIVTTIDNLIPFNEIAILGNVGQEVESRSFDSQKNNAKFTLAVRRTKDDTDWFPVEFWGKPATVAGKYVEKGSKVGVVGHLKLDSWTDKVTGALRTRPVIVGDRLTLAGKSIGEFENDRGTEQTTAYQQPAAAKLPSAEEAEPHFDDIPF